MKIKNIIALLFTGQIALVSLSQTDSVKIEYSQEKLTKANKIDEAICDILTRREKNEKDFWKFNLTGTFFGGFDISYEKKISQKWSFNIQSITNFPKRSFQNSEIPSFLSLPSFSDRYGRNYFSQNLDFQLRYYYNLGKRARLGKKIGFSGNYFGLSLNNHYYYSHSYDYYHFDKYLMNSLNIIYGIQRKIGKVGYIDANIGIGGAIYTYNQLLFDVSGPKKFSGWQTTSLRLSNQLNLGIGIAF